MAHAGQCPALFQVLAGRSLRIRGLQEGAGADSKEPKQRSSETEAAYRSFDVCQTPLAKAFRKGAGEGTQRAKDKAPQEKTDDSGESGSRCRIEVQNTLKKTQTGQLSIRQMFGELRPATQGDAMPGPGDNWPWTFGLRLGNPHQLCYMNAGVTSLLHASQGMRLADLAGIEALCRQYAGSGHVLVLSRQLVIRSCLPRWDFGPTQKDVSEFLLSFLSEVSPSWFRWETRQTTREGTRVVDIGGPLFLEVPGPAEWTPTLAFGKWSEAASAQHREATRAISRAGRVLIVQIGRYINGAKDTSRVDLTSDVLVPELMRGLQ